MRRHYYMITEFGSVITDDRLEATTKKKAVQLAKAKWEGMKALAKRFGSEATISEYRVYLVKACAEDNTWCDLTTADFVCDISEG